MGIEQQAVTQARYIVEIDLTSGYTAETDGNGNPIPFALLVKQGGDLSCTPSDNSSAVTIPIQDGYNPILFLAVGSSGHTAVGVFALYNSKPASVNA